jgi:hypothetical protein
MERRTMIAIPGIAALVASGAFSQTQIQNTARTRVSTRSLTSHGGLKSVYKIPKSTKKVAKFVNTFTARLALRPTQQLEATEIFTAAVQSHNSIKIGIIPLRITLGAAVRNNNTVDISQAAASISLLMGQNISNGALANAALFQLLTPIQQATVLKLSVQGAD